MKNLAIALGLVLALAAPAFADNSAPTGNAGATQSTPTKGKMHKKSKKIKKKKMDSPSSNATPTK